MQVLEIEAEHMGTLTRRALVPRSVSIFAPEALFGFVNPYVC
jgi:hypothetical protein